jgi:hypothetical protein
MRTISNILISSWNSWRYWRNDLRFWPQWLTSGVLLSPRRLRDSGWANYLSTYRLINNPSHSNSGSDSALDSDSGYKTSPVGLLSLDSPRKGSLMLDLAMVWPA